MVSNEKVLGFVEYERDGRVGYSLMDKFTKHKNMDGERKRERMTGIRNNNRM